MLHRSFVAAMSLAIACMVGGPSSSRNFIISNAATQNVQCSNGVCSPHGKKPTLNVSDLESLLASGDVQVTNPGRYGLNGNIVVKARLKWSAPTTLTLRAGASVFVDQPIVASGLAGLVIFDYSSALHFGRKRRVTFSNLSSNLTIGSISYSLVGTLPSLAEAITANPSGNFALANSYDASADGIYGASPIPTNFLGRLEGLGNSFKNISVNDSTDCCVGGLFLSLSEARISDLHLKNIVVNSTGGAAGLAYESFAQIANSGITGTITVGGNGDTGGLVSDNYGDIFDTHSTVTIVTGASVGNVNVGGLVGVNLGEIDEAFARGNLNSGDGSGSVGGLVGLQQGGSVYQSYADGSVTVGRGMKIGGLVGWNAYDSGGGSGVGQSYSIGAVSGGSGSIVGGLLGENEGNVSYSYFDTTTSGTSVGVALGNASGVTGLTTQQLQSGLPAGFEQGVWAEKSNINNGLPYLVYNPPPK